MIMQFPKHDFGLYILHCDRLTTIVGDDVEVTVNPNWSMTWFPDNDADHFRVEADTFEELVEKALKIERQRNDPSPF